MKEKLASDRDLIERYHTEKCEAAFAALVGRYAGLVYATAMRRLEDRLLAEDVSQQVFAVLARKVSTLRTVKCLSAWLHKTTVLESATVLRKERTRKRKLKELADTMELERPNQPGWSDALPILDELLAKMSRDDREVLIWHYCEGLNYREIARLTGKSEAAKRKQASRALNKLTRLLAQNGFVIPVAVVGTGLATELASAAPTGMDTLLTTKALTMAPSIKTSTLLANTVSTMTLGKTTSLGISTLVLLLLSLGVGYVAGRYMPIADRPLIETDNNQAAPDLAPRSLLTLPSKSQTTRRNVQAILRQAERQFRQREQDDNAYDKGMLTLEELQPADLPQAVSYLRGLQGDEPFVRRAMALGILPKWAVSDGRAAMEFALTDFKGRLRDDLFSKAMEVWASRQPRVAYTALMDVLSKSASVDGSGIRFSLSGVMKSWAKQDMDAALTALHDLPYDLQDSAIIGFARLVHSPNTLHPLLDGLTTIRDPALHETLLKSSIRQWAAVDGEAAAMWFDESLSASAEVETNVAAELGEQWVENSGGVEAIQWMWEHTPEHQADWFQESFLGDTCRMWAPAAKEKWLADHSKSNTDSH